MNTQGGFSQWVNETCRNLQAKVIKTAAFCHNRALQDLYPDTQWVNETCRNIQAKVIKTAAFCHNHALQDLYPDSYR
eukprot:g5087.t1